MFFIILIAESKCQVFSLDVFFIILTAAFAYWFKILGFNVNSLYSCSIHKIFYFPRSSGYPCIVVN